MKHITTVGIDLAKNVFQVHAADAKGHTVFSKRLSRDKLAEYIETLPVCLIGMEACCGAHYWARLFRHMGHTVKLMAPQFVKPYVMANKNDRNDARGIAEAVTRPGMKFVPIKTIEQQDIQLLHRARELAVKQRTAQANQIRGLLAEYGVIIAKGITQITQLPVILEANAGRLTTLACQVLLDLHEQFKGYDTQVAKYDKQLKQFAEQDVRCQELMKIEGIGPLTATAALATLGDAKVFKKGREVAAWLGLVPKQHSSGNSIRLSGISKRGDRYLRTLLIHGARSVVYRCDKKADSRSVWLTGIKQRCGHNKAAVALANKNARILWAVLTTGECYRKPVTLAA